MLYCFHDMARLRSSSQVLEVGHLRLRERAVALHLPVVIGRVDVIIPLRVALILLPLLMITPPLP